MSAARRSPITIASLLLLVAAGALLLWLAGPRTVAGFARLAGDPVLEALQADEAVSAEELERLARSRERALSSKEAASDWSELGLAYLEMAKEAEGGPSPERINLLDDSIAASRAALRLNPAQGYAWMRLAYAQFHRNGVTPGLAGAVGMALRTAPYDRRMVFVEIEFAFMVWSRLGQEARATAGRQIAYATRRDTERLARIAKSRLAAPIVRQALLSEPALLKHFEAVYDAL